MKKHTISFRNAFIGIYTATKTQSNIRFHLIAAISVFLLSVYLQVSLIEGLILLLTAGFVFVTEMVNTSIEFLSDAVTLEKNDLIKHAKDVAAGGVLISAILAMAVGSLIFLPKIFALLGLFS
jgi:diacylglycerol kinase